VALLKNRSTVLIFGAIFVLALIGVAGMIFSNPSGFLQGIAVIVVIGIAIYVILRLVGKSNPQKKEQRAFVKAAKKSKRRLQKKDTKSTPGTLATLKKVAKRKTKKTAHLTVIDGKKGKKKNRASF
jgi:ABC-type nickel/cobalt efflux system permease component RcnA